MLMLLLLLLLLNSELWPMNATQCCLTSCVLDLIIHVDHCVQILCVYICINRFVRKCFSLDT